MIPHHTKNKGDLGVAKVKCDLIQRGYLVLNPETEHAPFDIVAYHNGRFSRIQVKYRAAKHGRIELAFISSWTDKNQHHRVSVDKDNIDHYAIYCPDTDMCYYINHHNFNGSVTLRLTPPNNNQKHGIHFASDYEDFLLG